MTDTPPYRTKLIEVGLPLTDISKMGAKEKSIRQRHPSTLHLYWARRPISCCRAVLFASLVDDPSSDPQFSNKGEEAIAARRQELHDLISELILWENTSNKNVLDRAKAEIASSVASLEFEKGNLDETKWIGIIDRSANSSLVNDFLEEVAPPFLDPFGGGGSIPLEAQRLGLRSFSSDLNPLSVLINKAMLEYPPKYAHQPPINPDYSSSNLGTTTWRNAQGLAEDIKYYSNWILNEAKKIIGNNYPKIKITGPMATNRHDLKPYIGEELTVMAYLWSRTVPNPSPITKNAPMPLLSTFWLSKKKGKEVWLKPCVNNIDEPISFEIMTGLPPENFNPTKGNVGRGGAMCLSTNTTVPLDYIRSEGKSGRLNSQLISVIVQGNRERLFLPADNAQFDIADIPTPEDTPISDIPEKALSFCVQLYGMNQHWKLFTPRQLTALCTFSNLVEVAYKQIIEDHPEKDDKYAQAVAVYLAFIVDKCTDYNSTLCTWSNSGEFIRNTFGRQALPMVWDYAETNILSGLSGSWESMTSWVYNVVNNLIGSSEGNAIQHNATQSYDFVSNPIVSTDPPYYDNIGYADLSDFFYVWLRRTLINIVPSDCKTLVTPKSDELIATPFRHGGDRNKATEFFENGLSIAIKRIHESANKDYPVTIFYAYKQTEGNNDEVASTGWETFLNGLLDSNYQINATWPMRTEMPNRNVGLGTNALASSIVLACRPRPINAGMITRSEFLRELKKKLTDSLRLMQTSSITPVDLQQSAIGPGISLFSCFEKVIEADGTKMTVRTALSLINQLLDTTLTEQDSDLDPDTRFANIWFEQHGFSDGDFGTAEILAKAKAVSVEGVAASGILETASGKVRLLKIAELNDTWAPENDSRLTVWEITHHLCRALDQGGNESAADLIRRIGPLANSARDLAYRLFSICDKNKWTTEAQPYNRLVAAWPDIQHLAAQEPAVTTKKENASLFE